MELQDLTKAELIAIIHTLEKNSLCKRHVLAALNDTQRKSEDAAIEESEKAFKEFLSILNEYYMLFADTPQERQDKLNDILRRLNVAEKKMHDADDWYHKLRGF